MKKIQSLNYKFPHDFDAQAQDCVEKILVQNRFKIKRIPKKTKVVDASKRLGVVSLQELKQHSLFEGVDWSKPLQTVPQRLIDYTPKAGKTKDCFLFLIQKKFQAPTQTRKTSNWGSMRKSCRTLWIWSAPTELTSLDCKLFFRVPFSNSPFSEWGILTSRNSCRMGSRMTISKRLFRDHIIVFWFSEHLAKLLNAKKAAAARETKLEKQRREHPYHK